MIESNRLLLRGLAKNTRQEALITEMIVLWDCFLLDLGSIHSAKSWNDAAGIIQRDAHLAQSSITFLGPYFNLSESVAGIKDVASKWVDAGETYAQNTGPEFATDLNDFVEEIALPFFETISRELGYTRKWQFHAVKALNTALLMSDFFVDARPYAAANIWPSLVRSMHLAANGVGSAGREHDQKGLPDHPDSKSIWRYMIRTQQSLADALELSKDLRGRQRRVFKSWWFFTLEVTRCLEKEPLMWLDCPLQLTPFQKAQVWFQSRFGRVTFKR